MRRQLFVTKLLLLLTACGGGGGGSSNSGTLSPPSLASNESPVVSTANPNQSAVLGQTFNYDALQGGNTFSDPDGDTLSYLLDVTEGYGLSAEGTQIRGTPNQVGVVNVEVTASDPNGLSVTDFFNIRITEGSTSGDRNVLVIVADDLGKDILELYGQTADQALTPTIDKLAETGIVFNNFWATPSCSPTRAAALTGKQGRKTAVLEPGDAIFPSESIVHQHLRTVPTTAHYQNALIGKWHLGNQTSLPWVMGVDYFTGILSGGVDDYFDWTLTTNGVDTSKSTYITSELTNQAIGWINNQESPWFLWLAYNAPHTPFHLPPAALHTRNLSGNTADIEQNPSKYYLAAVEALDTEIGRLLSEIPTEKLANTTIIFLGDNGTPRRVISNDTPYRGAKSSLYEGGISTPLVVAGAGVERVGISDDSLISTTDLFATISELAGQDLPELHDSTSFAAKLVDSAAPGRDYIFSEHVDGNAIRSERYKLITYSDGSEELFDLFTDEREINNLIEDDSVADVKHALKAAIPQLLSQSKWIVNTQGFRSAYLRSNEEFVEVNVMGVESDGTSTTIISNATPNYKITVTEEVLSTLALRNATENVNLEIGQVLNYGENIGWSSQCGETGGSGWWPASGGSCPEAQLDQRLAIPSAPRPNSDECETGLGPVGLWLNGVPIFNWSDASSYMNQDVWHQIASEFRSNGMDLCNGHAGNGAYHHHGYSACVRQMVGDQGLGHSPIYGYAGDGYPIHGPYHDTGQLVETCWKKRDYSAASPTGCGSEAVRDCRFINEENTNLGVEQVITGPRVDSTVRINGSDSLARSGIYYEDYFYDASCTATSSYALDEHNGHAHDELGYHYHVTVDSAMQPVFPLVHGPDYHGEVSNGSFTCFRTNF
jgi:arylsulfatase A-like enzyme